MILDKFGVGYKHPTMVWDWISVG